MNSNHFQDPRFSVVTWGSWINQLTNFGIDIINLFPRNLREDVNEIIDPNGIFWEVAEWISLIK